MICGARFIICGSIFVMRGAFLFICTRFYSLLLAWPTVYSKRQIFAKNYPFKRYSFLGLLRSHSGFEDFRSKIPDSGFQILGKPSKWRSQASLCR